MAKGKTVEGGDRGNRCFVVVSSSSSSSSSSSTDKSGLVLLIGAISCDGSEHTSIILPSVAGAYAIQCRGYSLTIMLHVGKYFLFFPHPSLPRLLT